MLQIGILGCARICRRAMIAAIQQSGVAQLAAIASRSGTTSREWASEFSIPRSYDSYEALLADPKLDAVYIPLPNELHLRYVEQAAAAGKHILCEKPLALNVAEAQQMVASCRRSGVLLMEAFMWRHHPRVTLVRQMIADGRLGELRLIKMDFSFTIDPGDWRLDPARGGGALFDLGCYGINAARLFTGADPVEVRGWTRRHVTGVDMTSGFQLRFANGVQALLDCSFECPDRNRLELVGTRGVIELVDGVLPTAESSMRFTSNEGSETLAPGSAGEHAAAQTSHDQYTEQVRAFCAGIKAGRLPEPAEDGLANMRVLEAVKESLVSV